MQKSRLIVWLKRFIDVAWYLTLLTAAASIVILLIPNSEFYMAHTVKFELSEDAYSITSNNPAVENPILTEASGNIRYTLSGADRFFLLLLFIPSYAFVLLIIDRLRRILRAMLRGELLNRSSVNSLRTVGWLLIAAELSVWLGTSISNTFVARTFDFTGITPPDSDIFNLGFYFNTGSGYFSGFIILVVAEIIAYSITLQNERDALRDEQALTV